jgi:cytochrome c oxidase subunit 1
MFVSSQSAYVSVVFSVLSFLVAIPSAIKVFNWTATMYKGSIRLDAPMLYVMCFIGLFLIGGLTGLYLAAIAVDLHVTDTYFVVAHFHYVMVGATVSAYLGGIHFWWPKMTGRMYNEIWARAAAIILFIGFNLTFMPQFIVGYQGMPRRYAMYAPEFQVLNVCSTLGATVLALGYLMPFFYLLSSLRNGRIAGPNPWRATGLEWQTNSPPITFNFDKIPIVKIGPYAYNPAADEAEDARLEMIALQRSLQVARENLLVEHSDQNGHGSNGHDNNGHGADGEEDGKVYDHPTHEDVHGDARGKNNGRGKKKK